MEPQPLLRDHLLKAATHNLWDEAVKCLFDHADLLEADQLNEAALLSSQRNNTKARALQSLITRDKERVELSINDRAFRDLFEDIDPDLAVISGEEVPFDRLSIEISLPSLRTKLNNYLLSFGMLPTLDLLLEITKDKGPVHQLKNDFKTQQWEFSFQAAADLAQWYETEDHYQTKLGALITALNQTNLRNGWERIVTTWTAQPHQITATNYHLLFPEVEDIYPLIKTDNSQVDADKYRRLLHLAQDAYKLKDYDLALTYCRQVQEYVEPESAQLYEFLLQAFFDQQTANAIIEDALRGEHKLLQQLFVYVGRVKSLLQKNASPARSQGQSKIQYAHPNIAQKKVAHIVDGLSQSLQSYGARIDFDYVRQNERNNAYLEHRQKMERYLQVGVKICRFVEAKPTLVEILLNELAGGGKFAWIGTNDDHQLIDNYDFPAVGTFRSLLKQVEQENKESPQALFALNLRNSLKSKLNQVYQAFPKIKEKLSEDQERTLFQIISKWLHACKLAYLLFDCDRSFLELAIQDELTRIDGLLDWFTFDADGMLTERQLQGKFMTSNVKEEYRFILSAYYGETGWQTLEAQLIDKYYERWCLRTDTQYQQLRTKSSSHPDKEELRPLVAECVKRWIIAYRVRQDYKLVDQAIGELIGDSVLHWFVLFDEDGRGKLEPVCTGNFDPDQSLQELVEWTDTYDLTLAVKETVQNLYYKQLRYSYERIEPNSLVAETQREQVLNAVQQALYCYDLYPNQEFLQLPYVELVQERKFSWFEISEEGVANAKAADQFGIDPLDLLETLYLNGHAVGRKYHWEVIARTIAENRYRELKRRYDEEFHFLRRRNWQLHTRIPMVEILQACVRLFRQSGNYRYLELPDIEWVQNRGKLRWRFTLFVGFYMQHWQNHEISGFNYRREKREVAEWLNAKPHDHRPVLVGGRP